MTHKASMVDKGRLFGKVVYIFFCFYSMAVAQRFEMNIIYGAALFISLSATARMLKFAAKTTYDLCWLKILKLVLIVFFVLATAYVFILYPFLYTYPHTVFAVFIIILPFLVQEAQTLMLRGLIRTGKMTNRALLYTMCGSALLCIVLTSVLIWASGVNAFLLVAPLAVGTGLVFFRQWTYRDYASAFPKPETLSYDFSQIASARLYGGMVITSGVALNAFTFTYVLYMMLTHKKSFSLDVFVIFALITLVCSLIYLGTYRFLRRSLIKKIGTNAIFVLGTGIAIFAVYVFRDSWHGGGFAISVQTLLLVFGLMLQMIATMDLRGDILLVVKLQNKSVNAAALAQRTQRLEHWTATVSEAIFLAVLCLLISDPLIYNMDFDSYISLAPQVGSSLIIVPTAFLIASLAYSIRQPLTKKYNRRLKAYARIKEAGKDNPVMEKRLRSVLIKKYKKRIGVHVIRMLLRSVMYHTVAGRENVSALPGIFVFNHREVYGPIAAVVFLPYDMRPWILDKMIDKELITAHMYEGTFSRIKWLPVFMRKALTNMLSPLVVWALNSFEPIPVYRGTARSVLKTFELSVECLQSGDSILLFPENPEERYTESEQVGDFYRGFAHLGRLYFKKAKECVTFYPVYASRRGRELRIGEGVKYDPSNGRQEEARIVEALQQRMRDLQSLDEEG